MSVSIFVANQLTKYFAQDTLVKVGVGVAYLKNKTSEYKFVGPKVYENDDLILFCALPKRIELDGENMLELLHYEHNDFLADCYNLKQLGTCVFDEFSFKFNDKTYYDIDDVKALLELHARVDVAQDEIFIRRKI